jgi:hypothetical protein
LPYSRNNGLQPYIGPAAPNDCKSQGYWLINDIISDLLSLPTHSALKEIMRLRGIDCGTVRAPMEEVQESQTPHVRKIHEKIMQTIGELVPIAPVFK